MADLKNTVIADVGSINLPSGTTAQRPTNPPQGATRFNTDLGYAECYIHRSWGELASGRAIYRSGDGLVVELSYDDPASWPGSGTTWFDTSGNDNNFRIQSGNIDTGQVAMNFSTDGLAAKYKTDSTDVPNLVGDNNVTYVFVTRPVDSTAQWRTLTRGWTADHQVMIQSGGWTIGMYDNEVAGMISTGYSQQSLPGYPNGYQVWTVRWSTADNAGLPTYTLNVNGAAGGIYTASFINSNGRYNNSFYSLGGAGSGNNSIGSSSQPWGWIKYFAAYNRRLSDSEVQMTQSTLRNRYGI